MPIDKEKMKLGRVFNTNKMTWEFKDGSGVSIPQEKMSEIEYFAELSRQGVVGAGATALGILFDYKDKMQSKK